MRYVTIARPPAPVPTARRARVIKARIAARDAGTAPGRVGTMAQWPRAPYQPLPRWRV